MKEMCNPVSNQRDKGIQLQCIYYMVKNVKQNVLTFTNLVSILIVILNICVSKI